MSEQAFILSAALSHRLSGLKAKGCTVRVTHDYQSVAEKLLEIGKPYLTPTLSPEKNDFTFEGCFWVTISGSGKMLGAAGVKLERLGRERVSDYWKRIHQRQYPGANDVATIKEVSSLVDGRLSGDVVYFGDLFFSPELRKLNAVEDFGRAALYHAAITWRANQFYAFLKDRDLRRGFGFQLGLMSCIPRAQVWSAPVPETRGDHEACCYSSMDDVMNLAELDTGIA
ncbi:hypothetical protein [Leisingera sp. ANG-M7]|uniref:hypothetical protein n=1 Tax=Leisingera sp. ANG-M7 TaxID=1577902 RepID=UPI001269FB20|nr:hypothetical protein [Leisingera sp. ANG-M7]